MLINLTLTEQILVCFQAIRTAEGIVSQMSEFGLTTHYLPTLSKLAAKDWYDLSVFCEVVEEMSTCLLLSRFTARGSAAAMSHLCFDKMSLRTRQDVRALFMKLCSDETPFVRRAAALNIINMIRVHQQTAGGLSGPGGDGADGVVVMEFVEAFKSFARDDQVWTVW